jgi:uncharacterized coiled-coil protein SlyX
MLRKYSSYALRNPATTNSILVASNLYQSKFYASTTTKHSTTKYEKRLIKLEQFVKDILQKQSDFSQKMIVLDQHTENTKLSETKKVDELESKVDELESKVDELNSDVYGNDKYHSGLKSQVGDLESKVEELDDLESRVDDLETENRHRD